MSRIKRCQKCGHRNPEQADLCEVCEEFLGLVAPETVADPVEPEPLVPDPADGSPPVTPERATRMETAAPTLLYLELPTPAGNRSYLIMPGHIVGQAHPTSLAQVQIEPLPGVDRIHRQHGRFDWQDGQWRVTALDQRLFGSNFTNSTVLDGQRLPPGDSRPLRHGDRLALAGVLFTVRIA